jgi:hypothetical protein
VSSVVLALPKSVLDDLDVEAAADEQRRQVVPQIVEAKGVGQSGDGRSGRADRPLDRPRRRLPAGAVGDDVVPAPSHHRRRELHRQLLRDGQRRPGRLALERLAVTLLHRPHDAAHEVDVPDPQPDDLGGPQPDERPEQDRRAQVVGDRVVQRPHLLGRRDVRALTAGSW